MSGKIGRNEPCPCGSGKKLKKCCGEASEEAGFGPGDRERAFHRLEAFVEEQLGSEDDDALEEFWGEWLDEAEELSNPPMREALAPRPPIQGVRFRSQRESKYRRSGDFAWAKSERERNRGPNACPWTCPIRVGESEIRGQTASQREREIWHVHRHASVPMLRTNADVSGGASHAGDLGGALAGRSQGLVFTTKTKLLLDNRGGHVALASPTLAVGGVELPQHR